MCQQGMGNSINRGDKWDAIYMAKRLRRTTWIAETAAENVECLRVELKALSAEERGGHRARMRWNGRTFELFKDWRVESKMLNLNSKKSNASDAP
eukprot:1157173-Pelagomonas_calceolata.AAC.1